MPERYSCKERWIITTSELPVLGSSKLLFSKMSDPFKSKRIWSSFLRPNDSRVSSFSSSAEWSSPYKNFFSAKRIHETLPIYFNKTMNWVLFHFERKQNYLPPSRSPSSFGQQKSSSPSAVASSPYPLEYLTCLHSSSLQNGMGMLRNKEMYVNSITAESGR